MIEIAETAVRLGVTNSELTTEIETWLEAQVEPRFPLLWRPSDDIGTQVHNTAHLAECVGAMAEVGAWGVLERQGGYPWAQAMRVHGGFVVEVSGDGWAYRAYPIGSLGPDGPRTRSKAPGVRPGEPTGTSFLEGENIPTASGAAQVLWSWACGRILPAGYQLRDVLDDGE